MQNNSLNLDVESLLNKAELAIVQQIESATATSLVSIVTFLWGKELYGIPLEKVQEITKVEPITPVPGMPPALLGAMNLRGEILAVVDLRPLLKSTSYPPKNNARLIIVSHENESVSLLVDAIGDIVSVPEPDVSDTNHFILYQAVLPDSSLLNILNLSRILSVLDED